MNHAEFVSKMREKRPNTKVLGKYVGTYERIELKCRTHDVKFTMAPCKALHKKECAAKRDEECKHQRKVALSRTVDDVIRSIRKVHGNKMEVLRLDDPLRRPTVKCTVCKHVWTPSQSNLISKGRGCAKCRDAAISKKLRKTTAAYKQELAQKTNGTVQLIGEYAGAKRHNTYHCTSCKSTWTIKGGGRCRSCGLRKAIKAGFKTYGYLLGNRTVEVQGFEGIALDILQSKGVKPGSIEVDSGNEIPLIAYRFKGKNRRHYPDILVRKKNGTSVIIEVKGKYTFGLTTESDYFWESNKAKIRAALAQGIDYRFMLIDKKKLVPLPKLWYTMSRPKLRKLLGIS